MVYFLKSSAAVRCGVVLLSCLLSLAVAAVSAAAPAVEPEDPAALARANVEAFHATLIETLQQADHDAREQTLRPAIQRLFDTRRIAAISLGRTWRTLTDAEQDTFVDLLTTLIVATYADRFDNYSGQRFGTDGVTAVQSGHVVQTRLQRAAADDVALHYFVRDGLIFNVVADGVSDLSLRRADYNSIIKNEGYEQLLAHIRDKTTLARSAQ